MNRIVIADIDSRCMGGKLNGHGFGVAASFLGALGGKTDCWVAGGPIYASRFEKYIALPYNTESHLSVWENKRRVLANMRHLFRECRGDTIILQSCAVATAFSFLPFLKPKDCRVLSIQYNTMAIDSSPKRMIYALARPMIDGIICPRDDIGRSYGRPYCVVPDYIYSGPVQERLIPYAEKTYDFCMVGIISRDKGVTEMASRLKNTPHRVLIAGRPQEKSLGEELTAIAQDSPNITLRLGYLSEEEFSSSISASRYACLYYSGAYSNHSSGVIYDVLFRGVPVVGSCCESLKCIGEFGMGVNIESPETWNPAELMDEERYRGFQENINRYYKTHQKYREKLIDFVRG